MNGEINVVALVRGEEQYIFMFDEPIGQRRCGC